MSGTSWDTVKLVLPLNPQGQLVYKILHWHQLHLNWSPPLAYKCETKPSSIATLSRAVSKQKSPSLCHLPCSLGNEMYYFSQKCPHFHEGFIFESCNVMYDIVCKEYRITYTGDTSRCSDDRVSKHLYGIYYHSSKPVSNYFKGSNYGGKSDFLVTTIKQYHSDHRNSLAFENHYMQEYGTLEAYVLT